MFVNFLRYSPCMCVRLKRVHGIGIKQPGFSSVDAPSCARHGGADRGAGAGNRTAAAAAHHDPRRACQG